MKSMQSSAMGIFNVASRLLMSLIFLMAGSQKVLAYHGVQHFVESLGVPGGLMPLIIAVELGGALALLLGYQTRIAAGLLAAFTVCAASLVHFHPADQEQLIVFMDNLAMAGGLLLFVQYGGGAYALDALLCRRGPT